MKICIVAPMYNEEGVAKESIETISSYIKDLPFETKLVIVNDGSTDRTKDIIDDFIRRNGNAGLELISHKINKGYGSALRSGIQFAVNNNYDYVVFMDSDLTNHPKYLKDFYKKIGEGWGYIKATRYSKGGGAVGVPWKRLLISRFGNIFAKIITGLPLSDITNGFRAVKVDILRHLTLTENHFSIIIEELMKARKITNSFCEIPCVLGTRNEEAKPSKFLYNPRTFWMYIKYLFI